MNTVNTATTSNSSSHRLLGGAWFALMSCLFALTGCSNVERSRDWANENVSGTVLAQQVCATCHGVNGQSANTLFPKLAGQQKDYILGQLEAIKSRDRNTEHTRQFMWGPARYLTPKQMDEIATYFSTMPPMKAGAQVALASDRGQIIYHQGIPSAGVEPCASCHGNKAEGDANFPRLAGQHQYYLNYRARSAMTQILSNVSDADIAAVAAYVESIGEGGATPATLPLLTEKVAKMKDVQAPHGPEVFDSKGEAKNCHYSVWTYGWYCGDFLDALAFHLKNQ